MLSHHGYVNEFCYLHCNSEGHDIEVIDDRVIFIYAAILPSLKEEMVKCENCASITYISANLPILLRAGSAWNRQYELRGVVMILQLYDHYWELISASYLNFATTKTRVTKTRVTGIQFKSRSLCNIDVILTVPTVIAWKILFSRLTLSKEEYRFGLFVCRAWFSYMKYMYLIYNFGGGQ